MYRKRKPPKERVACGKRFRTASDTSAAESMLLLSSATHDKGRYDHAVDGLPAVCKESHASSSLCDATTLQDPGCEESLTVEGQDKEILKEATNSATQVRKL